jgi:hypothetical protein
MGMGNWNHAQKLDHCKQSSFLPFGIVINDRHLVPFTDAVDNTIQGLPNDENQVYTMHLLYTRVHALLDQHSDLLTFEPIPDIVSFCLKIYRCLWGSDAPPGHRSTWFGKGIYSTQTFVQNPEGESYIIYQEDLNKVMEHLIDTLYPVPTPIHNKSHVRNTYHTIGYTQCRLPILYLHTRFSRSISVTQIFPDTPECVTALRQVT